MQTEVVISNFERDGAIRMLKPEQMAMYNPDAGQKERRILIQKKLLSSINLRAKKQSFYALCNVS